MQTKIAVATEDGVTVSAHFGRAPYFEDAGGTLANRRERVH